MSLAIPKHSSCLPIIAAFFLSAVFLFPPELLAAALLDTSMKNAATNDFISYFDFKENKSEAGKSGLTIHSLYSSSWTCFLILGVDGKGRVVHMKLGVPGPLIDDDAVSTRGRDIVKSFVMAAALPEDSASLTDLAGEIYVRGLDLQPIKLDAATLTKMGKSSAKLHAYKVGKGPISSGDDAIFLEKMPTLAKRPSDLFQTVSGKTHHSSKVFKKCRLSFLNGSMNGAKKPMRLLWCEAWDEQFRQQHFKPACLAKP